MNLKIKTYKYRKVFSACNYLKPTLIKKIE